MDHHAPVPPRRLGPYPLTDDGIAALLARYEFHDAGLRRVVVERAGLRAALLRTGQRGE
ncbi:hypothetical protein [Kitasatospora sp. NPDC094011]|uniref:hypothetical protein n=1 Tax=Kitasatospora sp. NPDC094011 TaxID=3364090 RepID=UPI0038191B51